MNKTIEFFKKNVYGIEKIYISNQEVAKIISNITGKKTIDTNDINNFEKLGFKFTQILN